MNAPEATGLGVLQRALVRGASLVVPAEARAEWRREWLAELWHVRRACAAGGRDGWRGEREATCFCLGAFQDAFCVRRHAERRPALPGWLEGSPLQCLLVLGAALAGCWLAAAMLPGVRAERSLQSYRSYAGVVLIRDANSRNDATASILPSQFRAWAAGRRLYFDDFAFYQVAPRRVSAGGSLTGVWRVASASSNLFALLRLPLEFAQRAAADGLPAMVLSQRVWEKEFGGDPRVVGEVVRVSGREARIAGVAPRGSWRLPEKVDAWMLVPDSAFAAGRAGYVAAHLTHTGASLMWAPRQLITEYGPHDTERDLLGVSLDDQMPPPDAVFLFAMLLAMLAVPAVTTVSMGECNFASHRPSWQRRVCRWGFFLGKVALVLPAAYFASFDLAYARSTPYAALPVYLQAAAAFSLCLLGLSWACSDQRRRCPVCLHRVTHPARVGLVSQTFLGWNGTELMCMGGHTLLHVPALPTSWFATQRWLYLDGSWDFLFAG